MLQQNKSMYTTALHFMLFRKQVFNVPVIHSLDITINPMAFPSNLQAIFLKHFKYIILVNRKWHFRFTRMSKIKISANALSVKTLHYRL